MYCIITPSKKKKNGNFKQLQSIPSVAKSAFARSEFISARAFGKPALPTSTEFQGQNMRDNGLGVDWV